MNFFYEQLKEKVKENKGRIIFLCVGTNKVIGDSIGPRVGSMLKEIIKNEEIIGNMNNPLTYNRFYNQSFKRYLNEKFVIIIDSSLGPEEMIGEILFLENKLFFGKALYKKIYPIGDIAIKACVCKNLYNRQKNYINLKNVDINIVKNLSQKIVNYLEKIYE